MIDVADSTVQFLLMVTHSFVVAKSINKKLVDENIVNLWNFKLLCASFVFNKYKHYIHPKNGTFIGLKLFL